MQDVHEHLMRGSSPERVRVDFEVVHKEYSFDLSVPRFLFSSNQGWTTELNANGTARAQSISVGLGSNGDDLAERFTGFSTRYQEGHVFSDRLKFSIGMEGYHDLWNPATRQAIAQESALSQNLSGSGASNAFALYRTRRNIAPSLTFVLSRAISVSVGASFEKMAMEDSDKTSVSANAATAEVDFGYTDEGTERYDGNATLQRLDGRFGVRIATHDLGSDYIYSRQDISLRYEWRRGRNILADRLMAGVLLGQAPLFERFILGNSTTLPGWNRYAIDPLGGNRMVHNSASYGYRFQAGTAEFFYDAGLIGNGDRLGTVRHSLGLGFRQGIFNLAMAFPVYEGRIAPVFMAGMNY